ncbi:MAG TPA: DUF3883 domain-containing protein [Dyella sp.]|uniref:DUF3883 domain-containing protein n=1 Tax=Dyella sp. TaxID=1869338 RepID=UPI002D77FF5A|nr:DUF3883 domain-containing protein [Dyella sp.]HET6552680.1 DUF3883 domain-containing protein [Dyella sp.]
MAEAWARLEVEAAVADYRHMLILELNGQSYNKAAHRRQLMARLQQRSESSVERKHQNISAILRDAGCPYIDGYKPLGNYQVLLADVVAEVILDDPQFDRAATAAAEQPALPRIDMDFRQWTDQPPRPREVREAPVSYGFQPVHRDYLALEARNRSLGLAGEEMVMAYERARLLQLGKPSLSDKVEHVSKARGDGLGYDVLSFERDGRERFIEVKTTAFAKEFPFFMSRRELDFSSQVGDQFHLYRLFEFRREPRMFELHGDMRHRLWLDPVSYRAMVA